MIISNETLPQTKLVTAEAPEDFVRTKQEKNLILD